MRLLPPRFSTRIVGVTFVSDYPRNVTALQNALAGMRLVLARQPDNPVDPNAVQVVCNGMALGHLPAHLAARMAPEMDTGTTWKAVLRSVNIMPGHEDRPGVVIEWLRTECPRANQGTPTAQRDPERRESAGKGEW